MIKKYIALTKPGIVGGNLVTAAAGFLLASNGKINWLLFLTALLGLSYIMAAGCVFNNYFDRKMDAKMKRTKNRPLAKGTISLDQALIFGTALLIGGILFLSVYTNALTLTIALLGFFMYVVVYDIAKYRTSYATLIGSIAGAVPPVVGYTSVKNELDLAAFLLFMITVLWQMPHFYAIAIYRMDEYKAASIPVLPLVKGMKRTKVHMLLYIFAFIAAAFLLTFFGFTGYMYVVVASMCGVVWILLCLKGFSVTNDKIWARQMFLYSLVVVMAVCTMISIDS